MLINQGLAEMGSVPNIGEGALGPSGGGGLKDFGRYAPRAKQVITEIFK
jgi:hypothetical protein